MTKVEAIIQPSRFEAVKDALIEVGVDGMTVFEVRGHGRDKAHTESYRGRASNVDLLPKIKIEMVLDDVVIERAVDVILKTAPRPARSATARSSSPRSTRPSASATRSAESQLHRRQLDWR